MTEGLITEKITYGMTGNLGISLKIFGFSGKISRFQKISLKISRYQDFQKDYARFPDFNEDLCKISMKIYARFQ